MFKDTSELAENKLLLLYILNKLPSPTSNTLITQVVLENNLINYFSLQQYLSELVDNGFISDSKHDKTHKLTLTDSGKSTLDFFINRIPDEKLKVIDSHLENSSYTCAIFKTYTSSYVDNEGVSIITLESSENDKTTFSLKVDATTSDEASAICENWRINGSKIQESILELLNQK
ncbi:MAG: DUF4364 family protein [Clostridium sp.]